MRKILSEQLSPDKSVNAIACICIKWHAKVDESHGCMSEFTAGMLRGYESALAEISGVPIHIIREALKAGEL